MSGCGPLEKNSLENPSGRGRTGRLLPGALFSNESLNLRHGEGLADEDWEKVAEKMLREDPDGERSLAILRRMGLG